MVDTKEYAVVEASGKQYQVSVGQRLVLERVQGEAGSEIVFDRVLVIGGAGEPKFGTPLLAGAKVSAKIIAHSLGKKKTTYKKRRKKGYRLKRGHRQPQTELRIESITAA